MATGGSGRPLPTAPTRLRDIAVPAYGPTLLVSIGQGAILPLVALSARDLGAGIGLAAFFVALIGLGQLVGDLPAGALAARIGEQRALVGACVLDAVALLGRVPGAQPGPAGARHRRSSACPGRCSAWPGCPT